MGVSPCAAATAAYSLTAATATDFLYRSINLPRDGFAGVWEVLRDTKIVGIYMITNLWFGAFFIEDPGGMGEREKRAKDTDAFSHPGKRSRRGFGFRVPPPSAAASAAAAPAAPAAPAAAAEVEAAYLPVKMPPASGEYAKSPTLQLRAEQHSARPPD